MNWPLRKKPQPVRREPVTEAQENALAILHAMDEVERLRPGWGWHYGVYPDQVVDTLVRFVEVARKQAADLLVENAALRSEAEFLRTVVDGFGGAR